MRRRRVLLWVDVTEPDNTGPWFDPKYRPEKDATRAAVAGVLRRNRRDGPVTVLIPGRTWDLTEPEDRSHEGYLVWLTPEESEEYAE